jgi:hypothetical protein
MQHTAGSSDDVINRYQFRGNLDDTLAPNNPERQLIPLLSQKPRWRPFAGMYGLVVGPDDSYALPGKPLVLSEEEQGTGRVFLQFAPLAAGTIFNARFAAKGGLEGTAVLDVSLAGGNLILRMSSDAESLQESFAFKTSETDAFITAIIDFEITPDRFGASLALENPARETTFLALTAKSLNGEAVIRIGGTDTSAGYKGDTNGTAIFNGLALSYTRLPLSTTDNSALPEAGSEMPEEPSLPVP